MKDQAAACIILQRFLDFYNKDEEENIDIENEQKEKIGKNVIKILDKNIFSKINENQDYCNSNEENIIKENKDIFFPHP